MGTFTAPNKKGRPKSWTALINEVSTQQFNAQGKSKKEQICQKVVDLALSGERWACELIIARSDGPLAQSIDLTSGGQQLGASINFVGAPSPELATVDAEVIEEKDSKILIT